MTSPQLRAALKKYKERYPDLDKPSFIWGYVACINDIVDGKYTERKIRGKTK